MKFDHAQDQIVVLLRDEAGAANETPLDPEQWWALLTLAASKYRLLDEAYRRAANRAADLRAGNPSPPALPSVIDSANAMLALMQTVDHAAQVEAQAESDVASFKAQRDEAAAELVALADMRAAASGQAWLRVVLDGQPYALGITRDPRRAAGTRTIQLLPYQLDMILPPLG